MATTNWNFMYNLATKYYKEYGTLNLPNILYYEEFNLGQWLKTQRENYKKGVLSDERIKKLNDINIEWDNPRTFANRWNSKYFLLKEYYDKYHHLFVPISYETSNGIKLGVWLNEQRKIYAKGKLSKEKINLLNNLDPSWQDNSNTNTSFPEQAILFYIKQVFPNAQKYKSKEISEIDVFIPELKIGIEYDGNMHQDTKRDIKKTEVCNQCNIKLIRIRENKCPNINDGSYIIKLKDSSYVELERAISIIFNYLQVDSPVINIKNDYFKIMDIYIKKIDDTWYQMYEELKKYKESYDDINVPASYITDDGVHLGAWLSNIRSSRKNPDLLRSLTNDKIAMLDKLGMDWEPINTSWYNIYFLAKKYYENNYNLAIPNNFVTDDGIKLGRWLTTQRLKYKEGTLSQEYIDLLNELHIDWRPIKNEWERTYLLVSKYYQKNNTLSMPSNYTVNGKNLSSWINRQRRNYKDNKLNKEQIVKLECLGMKWSLSDNYWDEMYLLACDYYKKNKDLFVPPKFEIDGKKLGIWIMSQRRAFKSNKLSREKIEKLNKISMSWDPIEEQWNKMYNLAKEYYSENKNLEVPQRYVTKNGENLGAWITNLRQRKEFLDNTTIDMLNVIGMKWKVKMEWDDFYKFATQYFNEYGNVNVKSRQEYKGVKLGRWFDNQKRKLKENKLSKEEKIKLEKIGFNIKK